MYKQLISIPRKSAFLCIYIMENYKIF